MNPTALSEHVTPKVTFVLLTYNQEQTIEAALDGAFSQTYSNLSILVSDDGSLDATAPLAQQKIDNYKGQHRVTLNVNPTNLGLGRHVNRVMEIIDGELVIAAAGDDISEPSRVERLVDAWVAGEKQAMLIHSNVWEIDKNARILSLRRPELRMPASASKIAQDNLCIIGATEAWSPKVWDIFGPLPSDCVAEDRILTFRAALLGPIVYIDEPLVRYRVGGMSADHRPKSGSDYLFGSHMKWINWWRQTYTSHLKDLATIGLGDSACAGICKDRLALHNLRISYAIPSLSKRLLAISLACISGKVRSRSAGKLTLMYLFSGTYARRYERLTS